MSLTQCGDVFSLTTFVCIETGTELVRVGFNQGGSFAMMKRENLMESSMYTGSSMMIDHGMNMGNDVADKSKRPVALHS